MLDLLSFKDQSTRNLRNKVLFIYGKFHGTFATGIVS